MTFQVQIYWKDQKMERLQKMQSFFHSEVFKQGSQHNALNHIFSQPQEVVNRYF